MAKGRNLVRRRIETVKYRPPIRTSPFNMMPVREASNLCVIITNIVHDLIRVRTKQGGFEFAHRGIRKIERAE